MSYVYIQSEPGLFTVGFYDPNSKWQPESDHEDRQEAAKRVSVLNGSPTDYYDLKIEITAYKDASKKMYKALVSVNGAQAWISDGKIKLLWPKYVLPAIEAYQSLNKQ